MKPLIVTGTDTDVGKTVVAAMLTLALDGYYWKPIQSGTRDGTDSMRVAELTGLPSDRLLPERFVLSESLSPQLGRAVPLLGLGGGLDHRVEFDRGRRRRREVELRVSPKHVGGKEHSFVSRRVDLCRTRDS